MRSRSRHQRHIRLLKKLVEGTDYYVAHAWIASGLSMQGKVDGDGIQKFIDRSRFQGFRPREFFTPSITSEEGKMFFALMPRTKGLLGRVVTGWRELSLFVESEIELTKIKNEKKENANG